jgi:hypothetical protein
VWGKLIDESGFPCVLYDDVPDHSLAQCFRGVAFILDIDRKLREQPSVAGEVLILLQAPIGH